MLDSDAAASAHGSAGTQACAIALAAPGRAVADRAGAVALVGALAENPALDLLPSGRGERRAERGATLSRASVLEASDAFEGEEHGTV